MAGIQITAQQMSTCHRLAGDQFARRLCDRLRESQAEIGIRCGSGVYSLKNAPPQLVERCVSLAIAKARRLGLSWETSIAAFVALSFLLGPAFDEAPDVRALLTDPSVPNEARVDHVVASLSDWRVQELRQLSRLTAWPT